MKSTICKNNSNNIIIYNTIRKLGLRPSHSGTIFVLKAVELIKKQSDIIVINNIYVEIAKIYNSFTSNKIKVAIKYAIDNRNEQKTINNFKDIFGYDYDDEIFTNKGFIEEIARIV